MTMPATIPVLRKFTLGIFAGTVEQLSHIRGVRLSSSKIAGYGATVKPLDAAATGHSGSLPNQVHQGANRSTKIRFVRPTFPGPWPEPI